MEEQLQCRIVDLSVHYHYEDRATVEVYLRNHPELLPYLEQSPAEIEKYFPNSDLTLTVELDEDEDHPEASMEKLFLLISVPDDLTDGLARLDQLDEKWSVHVCESTNELLVIDIQY